MSLPPVLRNSEGKSINITISSVSLQPLTDEPWSANQQYVTSNERQRPTIIYASDAYEERLQGTAVTIEQISRDFPFGPSVAKAILGNCHTRNGLPSGPMQQYAAIFEDELKWYGVEPQPGKVNYTVPDQMLEFVRENQMVDRGHNVFWENPNLHPHWFNFAFGAQAVLFDLIPLLSRIITDKWSADK